MRPWLASILPVKWTAAAKGSSRSLSQKPVFPELCRKLCRFRRFSTKFATKFPTKTWYSVFVGQALAKLGALAHDLDDDIARIAAAVGRPLQQLVEILQEERAAR